MINYSVEKYNIVEPKELWSLATFILNTENNQKYIYSHIMTVSSLMCLNKESVLIELVES